MKDVRAILFAVPDARAPRLFLREILGRPAIVHAVDAVRRAGIADVTVLTDRGGDELRKVLDPLGIRPTIVNPPTTTNILRACARANDARQTILLSAETPTIAPSAIRELLGSHRRTKAVASTSANLVLLRSSLLAAMTRRTNGALPVGTDPLAFCREHLHNTAGAVNAVASIGNEPRVRNLQDLAAAAAILRRRIVAEKMAQGVVIVDPETTYIEEGVEIGAGTVILPFTVIHHGVKIGRHCEVGPFSHLRSGAVLDDHAEIGNFVEVKKSRVGSHSKAKHLSYLGDATLGKRVNIGAGTITANYDGKHKHSTVIDDGASTGSNTVLVAPIRLGRRAKTGAGAVVVSGNDVPDGATVVGVPARVLRKGSTVRRGAI